MKKVLLGNTGIEVSIAGIGVLPIGPSQLALPVDTGAEIIRYAFDHGMNFIDTAQYYRTYPYIRKALENGNYNHVVICSKCLEPDYDSMMYAILEARSELDRDVIDIFLMHEVRSGQLEERTGAWQALKDAKQSGLVRAIGLSTHHVDIAEAAAGMPDLDVVFPLINSVAMEDVAMAAPQPKVLNLQSTITPSSIFRNIFMMSPHFGLPTVPTPSASGISPTLRGLVKWSSTFSL